MRFMFLCFYVFIFLSRSLLFCSTTRRREINLECLSKPIKKIKNKKLDYLSHQLSQCCCYRAYLGHKGNKYLFKYIFFNQFFSPQDFKWELILNMIQSILRNWETCGSRMTQRLSRNRFIWKLRLVAYMEARTWYNEAATINYGRIDW